MSDQGTATDEDLARHRDAVYSYIRSIARNETDSEDLTQLVMMKAHTAIDTLGDRRRMLPWLYRIATNVCYDHFRRSGSQGRTIRAVVDLSREDDQSPRLDLALEQSEMSACVQDYLEEIPDAFRAVILLHDVHGMSNPEIAAMLGVSLATVKVRVHRARQKLRDVLTGACSFTRDERGVIVCERSSAHRRDS